MSQFDQKQSLRVSERLAYVGTAYVKIAEEGFEPPTRGL